MLSFAKRVKVVKELILLKLDTIISRIEVIDVTKNIIISHIEKIAHLTSSLLENDTSLLQSSVHVVKALQQVRNDYKQQQYALLQKLETLQQQLQADRKQQQYALLQKLETLQQNSQSILDHSLKAKVNVKTDQYSFLNPEVGLMNYLYSYLPSRNALDIGAHAGEVSERLLKSGYEVYAFEPFPPMFDKLHNYLSNNANFHSYSLALGSTDETREFYLATDFSSSNKYKDSTLFNSLIPHSMPDDLTFTSTIQVSVRSLESLHNSLEIPDDIGLVKVDTEGFDLEVIRGMGKHKYPVVITEFWDTKLPFGKSGALNKLEDLVREMKQRGYNWHIVMYRIDNSHDVAFYCNYAQSIDNSWGNAVFFQDYHLFTQALNWCSAVLPVTYFYG